MIYQSKTKARAAAEMMKNYAQPQRLMILSFLAHGEKQLAKLMTPLILASLPSANNLPNYATQIS